MDLDRIVKIVQLDSLERASLSQEESVLAVLGAGTLYFLTRAVLDQHGTNNGITITSPKDIIQYGVGTGVQGLISRYLCTPRVVAICVTNHSLPSLPKGVGNLANLREINVSGNLIERIPEEIGRLRSLETLDIHNNCIRELPESLGGLASLQELNAMGNRIERVPESLGRLRSLQVLGLKDNCLTELPDVFSGLQELREVYLTGNTLESLPDSMCECQSLVKIQLSHNGTLKHLPEKIGQLSRLELFRAACCDLQHIPESLMNAHSLSWLSIAGNPLAGSLKKPNAPCVSIDDVMVGKKLGDGASGEVFEGEYKKKQVAVKLFRKDTSPDGHCEDEIAIACMLHDDNLVNVLARIDHPHLGVVMEYVEGSPLALKPNKDSVLRCRWKEGQLFPISFVLRCLSSVSGALEHMHTKGIAHGDVYAHNVLARDDGTSILCDYGAAFAYQRSNKQHGLFELHDVRAFGLLVRDLIERVDISFADMETAIDCQKQLLIISQQCLAVDPHKRPTFAALARKIRSLERASASTGRTPRSDSRIFFSRHAKHNANSRSSGSQTAR
ncbi:hypothetical protein M9435_003648 [Picochlorum sp. BPE23]|nr:hypothetical protein M9435_003648 [Picochlorum sp. BPE23]